MTDPSEDGDPAPAGTAANVPAGVPGPTIADHDGGVACRLTTRCRVAASVLAVFATLLLLFGVLRSWSASAALFLLLAAGALAWAATLHRRARLWSSVASAPITGLVGRDATAGPPKRLSPGIPGAPVKRRLGATVVPMRSASDPQPGGGALVVHARADGLHLTAGDEVRLSPAARVGFGSTPAQGSADATPAETVASGRFVLYRASDGAVFLATTRLSDTW